MTSQPLIRIVLSLNLCLIAGTRSLAQENYPVHAESKVQVGVPKGAVKGPFEWKSRIFPGTVRDYGIYVPAQYDPKKPACVMVVQDGPRKATQWKLPTVLDNLIHKGEVPVQIGVFVSPGVVPAAHDDAQPRFNRSFEYDGLGDAYARFLVEEILPEVSKSYNLSTDPNDYCIAGSSSGGICAFTAAWERPDRFRRVLSTVGTFVSLRGGNEYPSLIRKFENKPLRIFLQDGSNDLDIYGGSWWMANQSMLSALKFSGYDVTNVWGKGGHNGKHATAILPDALKWLWRDYPRPIRAGTPPNRRTSLVLPGEDWQVVSRGHGYTDSPAVDATGAVFFADLEKGAVHRIGLNGDVSKFADAAPGIGGLMFGPDGLLYGCHRVRKQIVRFDKDGRMTTFVSDASANDIVILHDGSGYFSDPSNKQVGHFTSEGTTRIVAKGIEYPNGLIVSPDQTLLTVADMHGRFTYSFQIQSDGKLSHPQKYGHLHVPDDDRDADADGMTVDTEGRQYIATSLGIQVFDQLGRCHLILNMPAGVNWISNLSFGGADLDTLYITCEDKVLRRKLKATGVVTWDAPLKPPRPRL